ncbi:MAG: tRNA (adenosine(37)-N6)-threonylcarbamoyltransferase complex ATPase subunit type 1 TsaE [Parcubacteria group bacterium]
MDKAKKKKIVQETKKNIFSAGFITTNAKQTQKIGELLAQEILAGSRRKGSTFEMKKEAPRSNLGRAMVICLSGDLGSGKTTFTQGLLEGLKVAGPYISPTFVIMKKYKNNIFHFDAYRVSAKDILNIGWEEIIKDKNNIIIVEWADRIKKIIPKNSLWIKFEWVDANKRKVTFN